MKIRQNLQRILSKTWPLFLCFMVFSLSGCSSLPNSISALTDNEASISATNGIQNISFFLLQPEQYLAPSGEILVSVEVPKDDANAKIEAIALPFVTGRDKFSQIDKFAFSQNQVIASTIAPEISEINAQNFTSSYLHSIPSPVEHLAVTFPPSPNDEMVWKTFALDLTKSKNLMQGPIQFRLSLGLKNSLDFTRVLVGKPSSSKSKMLGAFSSFSKVGSDQGPVIKTGVDYLGTVTARQHIRIPANTLMPGTESFDEMVEFGGAPFDSQKNNIDTVMVRTRDVSVNGTTPVRLIRFANESKEPIKIKSDSGDLYYKITARLSPNAESGGFITFLADGTYKSTTSLYPVLEFQKVTEDNKAIGEPIVVDTAVTPVPGFPFYLASKGGKWTEKAPSGRLVTAMSSNFYYNNGEVNTFIHSNGPGLGIAAACAKASPVSF